MIRPIKLDARLAACAALVRRGSSVADIGTDHALLPIFLWQSGWTDIIASDIKPGPLNSARENVMKYGANVNLILSDGFENLPLSDDIIIAGMGGETIAEILEGCKLKDENTRFILQPMTKLDRLRERLFRHNYEIIAENLAACARKTYTILHVLYKGES
jgi:tRNA (adenine22-N1)-methyltransferase